MAFDAFALILSMLALGMLFACLEALPASASEVLKLVVLYVCLPASILIYVPRLQVDVSLAGMIATPWLLALALATVALVALVTRLLAFRRAEHAVLLLCVALGNTSFIGYPMVRALLGETALPYAVVYDQFGTFVLLSTFACTCWPSTVAMRRRPPGRSCCASPGSRRCGRWCWGSR